MREGNEKHSRVDRGISTPLNHYSKPRALAEGFRGKPWVGVLRVYLEPTMHGRPLLASLGNFQRNAI